MKNKYSLLIVLFFAISFTTIKAQQIKYITFTDSIMPNFIIPTDMMYNYRVTPLPLNDGYLLTGSIFASTSNPRYYTAKIDFEGNLISDTIYNFPPPSFSPPSNVNSFVTLKTTTIATTSVTDTSFREVPFIYTTDFNGNFLWNKYYSLPLDSFSFIENNVLNAENDEALLFGLAYDESVAAEVIPEYGYAMKIANNGAVLWDKFFSYAEDSTQITFTAGATTIDSGFVLAGMGNNFIGEPLPMDTSAYHFVNLIKLDALGNKVWGKAVHFTDTSLIDNHSSQRAFGVAIQNNTTAYLGFIVNQPNGNSAIGIIKFNPTTGTIDWIRKYYDASTSLDPRKIIVNAHGYVFVSYSDSNMPQDAILKIDSLGSVLDAVTIRQNATHTNPFYYDMNVTNDQGVMLVSDIPNQNNAGALFIKTNSKLQTCADTVPQVFPSAAMLPFSLLSLTDSIREVTFASNTLPIISDDPTNGTSDPYCGCNLSLSGTIYTLSLLADSAEVSLYRFEPSTAGQYELIADTLSDANGNYQFNYLPQGFYIIKARPLAVGDSNFVATYYAPHSQWDSASVIYIDCYSSTMPYDISLMSVAVPQNGQWACRGHVYEYYGYISGSKLATIPNNKALGDPIPDIDITIDQSPGGVVGTSSTNTSGFYEFTGLNLNATFIIRANIPGLPNDSIYTVETTVGSSPTLSIDSLNFYIGADTVFILNGPLPTSISPLNKTTTDNIVVYPNPTNTSVTIKIESQEGETIHLSLIDLLGKVMEEKMERMLKGTNKVQWDLSNYPTGIYILKASNKEKTTVIKIIKE